MTREAATGPGPVVLDIGGDVGALVLRAGPEQSGVEVEMAPVGAVGPWRHVEVLGRGTSRDGEVFAAVFSGVPDGEYVLRAPGGDGSAPVRVRGGEVTQAHWDELGLGPARPGSHRADRLDRSPPRR